MVPRWGVLYATARLLTNRYAGDVFVRIGASGHLFIDHYLDPIFPLPSSSQKEGENTAKQPAPAGGTKGAKANAGNGGDEVNGHRAEEEADDFLGAVVDVDMEVEKKRRSVVGRGESSLVNGNNRSAAAATGANNHHPATVVNGSEFVRGAYGTINGMPNEEERTVFAVPARGKTVRELSRLWRYLGGEVPEQ